MQVNLKWIGGPWDAGWVLDKHMRRSVYLGDDAHGHARFQNDRTEAGEAIYQLKYRGDLSQVARLAEAVARHICPLLPGIGLLVEMNGLFP